MLNFYLNIHYIHFLDTNGLLYLYFMIILSYFINLLFIMIIIIINF